MSNPEETALPVSPQVDEVCDRFEQAWRNGERPRIEDYLGLVAEAERHDLLRELILVEAELRKQAGEALSPGEYCERFPGDTLTWLKGPHRGVDFGGQAPLEVMVAGAQDGILTVRRHLDAWRAGGLRGAPAPGRGIEPVRPEDLVFV